MKSQYAQHGFRAVSLSASLPHAAPAARSDAPRPIRSRHQGGSRPDRRGSGFLPSALTIIVILGAARFAWAQNIDLPALTLNLDGLEGPGQVSGLLKILAVLTVLSLAPSIVILTTCFTRIMVVFSMMRQALGTQQSPPTQLLIGLALFLTFFVMQPVGRKIYQQAIVPYQEQSISGEEFINRAAEPLKAFMLKQTRKKDLALFISLAADDKPKNAESLSLVTVIPAFVISELTTAFEIGFLLYIPFIVLDMVVSSILLSMGMMMLPPVMISLPFKLMLFVLVDGWSLLIGSLVKSFH